MSGPRLDGVDAVLAAGRGGRLQLLDSAHLSYPSRLRERLLALHRSGNDELNRAALLANELSDVYASAVRRLLARAGVGAPGYPGTDRCEREPKPIPAIRAEQECDVRVADTADIRHGREADQA